MGLLSSLRDSRKKGGGGGEVNKNAKGIGEDPFSPLPSSPSLSTPTNKGTAYLNAGLFILCCWSHADHQLDLFKSWATLEITHLVCLLSVRILSWEAR